MGANGSHEGSHLRLNEVCLTGAALGPHQQLQQGTCREMRRPGAAMRGPAAPQREHSVQCSPGSGGSKATLPRCSTPSGSVQTTACACSGSAWTAGGGAQRAQQGCTTCTAQQGCTTCAAHQGWAAAKHSMKHQLPLHASRACMRLTAASQYQLYGQCERASQLDCPPQLQQHPAQLKQPPPAPPHPPPRPRRPAAAAPRSPALCKCARLLWRAGRTRAMNDHSSLTRAA